MEGKIKYFHSKTFLGLTDTVKSKINIYKRKIVNDNDTKCYSKKKSKRNIKNDRYSPVYTWGYINAFGTTTFTLFSFFKRVLVYGTWVYPNHLCHMTLVAKPERDG